MFLLWHKFLHIHFTPILFSNQLTNHLLLFNWCVLCAFNAMVFHTGHIFSAVAHFSVPSFTACSRVYLRDSLIDSPVFILCVCVRFFSFSNSFPLSQFPFATSKLISYKRTHKFTQYFTHTHRRIMRERESERKIYWYCENIYDEKRKYTR